MKKLGILVLFAVLFPMLMVSCKEDIVENVKVSLNRSVLTLDKGQTALLTASVTPSSSKVDLKWSSSDNSVATVNADGDVEAIGKRITNWRVGDTHYTRTNFFKIAIINSIT